MSSYVAKKAVKHYLGEFNGGKDPFSEEYEVEEKSRLHGTVKTVIKTREKPIPAYIPADQQKLIRTVRMKAYRRELMFNLFGIKFGWLNVLQLIPVVGGLIGLYFQYGLIMEMQETVGKFPAEEKAIFTFNVIIDFLINLIPVIGDFLSALYKPNCRNVMALEKWLDKKNKPALGAAGGFFSHFKKDTTIQHPPATAGTVSSTDTAVEIPSTSNTQHTSSHHPNTTTGTTSARKVPSVPSTKK